MIQRQIQMPFEHPQGWWFHYLPRQRVPMLDHPNSEETLLSVFQSPYSEWLCVIWLSSISVWSRFPLSCHCRYTRRDQSSPHYTLPSSIFRTSGNAFVKGALLWILGINISLKGSSSTGTESWDNSGLAIFQSIQKPCGYGAWGHGFMVDLSVLGWWLDSMILVVFSSLNDSDSILTISFKNTSWWYCLPCKNCDSVSTLLCTSLKLFFCHVT